MSISTPAAAKLVCQQRDWQVSNLALQKILFVAQMAHLGQYGDPLLTETFEAWDYGPVLPSLYRQVSMFGSGPVKDVFYDARLPGAGAARSTLANVAAHLASKTPGQLVNITHWDRGAWAKVYRPGFKHIPIPNELILEEYGDRRAAALAARAAA